MIKVVGVRFRTAGKIYYFDPQDYEITLGSHVIEIGRASCRERV